MNGCKQRRVALSGAFWITILFANSIQSSFADTITLSVFGMVTTSSVNGAALGAGDYSLQGLAAAGAAVGSVSANGLTGVPLWALLGGNSAGVSDVVTSTPDGYNSKNAILRSYVLATTVTGARSIISLGEIDPFFGGTAAVPPFIAFSGVDGQAALIFPGSNAAGGNLTDLASLQVLAAPALPTGAGGTSSSFSLSGNVTHPGTYTAADLQALPAATATIAGDTYTGVPLWSLLNTNVSNEFDQYVLVGATDGYEVLYSLAELDPSLGAPEDLVPYADTQGQFPSSGFARTVIPGDNHQGRYVSNIVSIDVTSVPEPGTIIPIAASLFALYFVRRSRSRK